MPKVRLASGLTVSCLQKHDVAIVNAEVQTYFENGITVNRGDTVVDVGANIGLFALAAWMRGQGEIQIHCLEPVEAVFKILQENLLRYDDGSSLVGHCFGLSNRAGPAEFAYYPNAPVLSTAYPEAKADHQEIKQATLTNIIYMPEAPIQLKILRWLPSGLREWIIDRALRRTLRYNLIHCELKTLSQFASEQGITRVDLLKIDAEKAELDILQGINPGDWSRIRQVVVDVHDIDNRLETVLGLLRDNGLKKIAVEQPPTLHGSSIYTLLATRV
ncbi:MAG: FkbM family methyltransferase [Gammaproteobacteria bacterium]